MPAVSYLKAPGYQDCHAAYSDPIDEQKFLVDTVNHLQKLPDWKDTAVVVAYDDSDGWYDHKAAPITNTSTSEEDALTGAGQCGPSTQEPAGNYQGKLHRPHPHGPVLHPALRRRQLEDRPHR
ncbi:MAG: hypothetical protein NVSMB43_27560 [Pseudarthrobacter sp.]